MHSTLLLSLGAPSGALSESLPVLLLSASSFILAYYCSVVPHLHPPRKPCHHLPLSGLLPPFPLTIIFLERVSLHAAGPVFTSHSFLSPQQSGTHPHHSSENAVCGVLEAFLIWQILQFIVHPHSAWPLGNFLHCNPPSFLLKIHTLWFPWHCLPQLLFLFLLLCSFLFS